jgi:hypothetical protein
MLFRVIMFRSPKVIILKVLLQLADIVCINWFYFINACPNYNLQKYK